MEEALNRVRWLTLYSTFGVADLWYTLLVAVLWPALALGCRRAVGAWAGARVTASSRTLPKAFKALCGTLQRSISAIQLWGKI